MLTKTKLAFVAAALLGFASSAMAAPVHGVPGPDDNGRMISTYSVLPGPDSNGRIFHTYADPNCTSCNLGSY
ncbi:MAG: hypothetical protein ACLPKB_30420 [Xanthobacteraceae bacterium]